MTHLSEASPLCELTILMPCLDEAETLARCIGKARGYLAASGVAGEVLIADNGSTDGSQQIAIAQGARLVQVARRGYGAALAGGILAAHGRYVILADSDDSYDFSALQPLVDLLRQGSQLVMGNRFRGGIMPGAMPPLHRYLGNPLLTAVGRRFFRSPVGDFHCGLRGFERAAILSLGLRTPGMEFASEMVVKATLHGLRITEVPVILWKDGRSRPPHLRSWRDGWRHLRFLLLSCPRWLFLYPGLALFLLGAGGGAVLLPGPRSLGGVSFDIHTLAYCAAAMVVGLQAMLFWRLAQVFGEQQGVVAPSRLLRWRLSLEASLAVAAVLLLVGLTLGGVALGSWHGRSFAAPEPDRVMRLVIPSMTAILLSSSIVFSAFFLSLLGMAGTPVAPEETR